LECLVRFQWIALALGVLPGCTRPPSPSRSTSSAAAARAAVDSQLSDLFSAYRRRDGAAFAQFYASDATLRSAEMSLAGRAAIADDFTKGLASVLSVVDDTITTEDVVATDDLAIQTGHIVWTETDKGKPPVKSRLDFALTWRKEPDGVWRIAHDLDAESHP
jgi:uncharacterized protein (TIGR02246 family)